MNSLLQDLHFVNVVGLRLQLTQKNSRLWNCRCPICGDSAKKKSKKRFYIYEKDGSLKTVCHNCEWGGAFWRFLQVHMPDVYKDYIFHMYQDKKDDLSIDQIKSNLEQKTKESEKKEKKNYIEEVSLYQFTESFEKMKPTHPARKLVERRSLPLKKIRFSKNFYDLTKQFNQKDKYKGYPYPCIIIPFYKKNKRIEIFQARFFDPKIYPKYLTVKFNEDALKIYNEDYVDESKTVYILEGAFDSLFVDNAVAMAGADLNVNFKDQVWVYDNERKNEEINKKLLTKIENNVKVVIWKPEDHFKDINDGIMKKIFTKEDVMKMLKERTYSGLKAKLEFTKFKRG